MESKFRNVSVQQKPRVDLWLWGSLFEQGNIRTLSEHIIHQLAWFQEAHPIVVGDVLKREVNRFIELFLDYFTSSEFTVPDDHIFSYLSANALIANLAAISNFSNTDKWLETLVQENQPAVKILTLYSMRNSIWINTASLFDRQPFMASNWYAGQKDSLLFPVQSRQFENGRKLISEFPVKYRVISPKTLNGLYYPSTYIAPDYEPEYKSRLNEVILRDCPTLQQRNNPSPRKLAIITRRWHHGSAVHRSLLQYIHSLQDHFELTLVHIGPMTALVDTRGFSDVRNFPNMSDVRKLTASQRSVVEDQDWSFVFFPDVGMDCESIYLANQRLAPLQAAGYGHPASTHSKEIDYYFAGQAVEKTDPGSHYFSERLVLLPGVGMHPVWPLVDMPVQVEAAKPGGISINCVWPDYKIQPDLIADMRKIIRSSSKPVLFRIFGGFNATKNAGFPVYRNELENVLGKRHVELLPMMPIKEYYREMTGGQITMMPFPFSGYNTVVDSLYLRIPIVARSGEHGYSNFPVQVLRDVGLQELIACSREEYIEKIVNLVNNDQYRTQLSEKMLACDFQGLVVKEFDAAVFRRAVEYLLENHDSLSNEEDKTPLHMN